MFCCAHKPYRKIEERVYVGPSPKQQTIQCIMSERYWMIANLNKRSRNSNNIQMKQRNTSKFAFNIHLAFYLFFANPRSKFILIWVRVVGIAVCLSLFAFPLSFWFHTTNSTLQNWHKLSSAKIIKRIPKFIRVECEIFFFRKWKISFLSERWKTRLIWYLICFWWKRCPWLEWFCHEYTRSQHTTSLSRAPTHKRTQKHD